MRDPKYFEVQNSEPVTQSGVRLAADDRAGGDGSPPADDAEPPDGSIRFSVKEEQRLAHLADSRRLGTAIELTARAALIGMLFAATPALVRLALGSADHHHHWRTMLYISIVPAIILVPSVLSLSQLIFLRSVTWPKRYAQAQTLENEIMILGFTDLFRIYVRTRKSGIYGFFWFVLSAYAAAVIAVEASYQEIVQPIMLSAFLLLVALSVLNAIVAYQLSKHFQIGRILIDHVLIMNERANQAQVTPDSAREKTARTARWYRKNRYWWFY